MKKSLIQSNDLVFSAIPGKENKYVLLRVVRVDEDTVLGVLESERHLRNATMEVALSSVALNVGPDPAPGTVYGHDLSYLFRRYREIPYIGEVGFFCRVTKDEVSGLKSGVDLLHRQLKRLNLEFLLGEEIAWEVVSKEYAGKWSGMYSRSRKEGQPHRIQLTVDKSRMETSSVASYAYVVAHELGHHVHYEYVKAHPKADSHWIRAYQNTVRPLEVSPKVVSKMLDVLISERSVRAMKAMTEEDLIPHQRKVLKEVRESAGLSPKELDRLLESGQDDHVRQAWPRSGVMLSSKHPSVTEYALKNYNELFAETFAFYVMGQSLPAGLAKLMQASMRLVTPPLQGRS